MPVWEHQRELQIKAESRFHSRVFAVSAGSFGVSFAFINQIVPLAGAEQPRILLSAWLFFGISVVLAVLEPRVYSFIQDFLLDEVERNLEKGYKGEPYTESGKLLAMLPARLLNWAVFIFFLLGVICLLWFVRINLAA